MQRENDRNMIDLLDGKNDHQSEYSFISPRMKLTPKNIIMLIISIVYFVVNVTVLVLF